MSKKKTSIYKICSGTGGCGKRKVREKHFHINKNAKDGYRSVCKTCMGVKNLKSKDYPFFSTEVLSLCRHHPYVEVKKFGYFYGVLIYLRPREIIAFSVVTDTGGGSRIFEKAMNGRAWLYKVMILAGDRTRVGLTRNVK